ncbi:MAG: DUF488 domain-containing protein [Thermoplasmata archaeon]|nr:DUF488 domain-containing protein [Thermoplasmata archaeon]
MDLTCFTIGHSNHSVLMFIELLQKHNISLIIDVRSHPYSKHVPDYNKDNITQSLSEYEIEYAYLGNELGGRTNDHGLLNENGQTDYLKVMQTINFKSGIKKVKQAIEAGEYLALMCTEKNPLDCHRFILISRALSQENITVKHILDTGETVNNEELEKQLLNRYNLDNKQMTLFEPRKSIHELISEVYERRGREISYKSGNV